MRLTGIDDLAKFQRMMPASDPDVGWCHLRRHLSPREPLLEFAGQAIVALSC